MEKSKLKNIILKAGPIIILIGIVFYFSRLVNSNESVQYLIEKFGYTGIFLISVMSGFNIIIPIPLARFLIPVFLQANFGFWQVALIVSVGMTVGDMLSYFIGHFGRHVVIEEKLHHNWFLNKIIKAREKNPILPYVLLFIFVSIIPLPNELTVLPLGFMGYRLTIIVPILFLGNLLFNFLTVKGILVLFDIF